MLGHDALLSSDRPASASASVASASAVDEPSKPREGPSPSVCASPRPKPSTFPDLVRFIGVNSDHWQRCLGRKSAGQADFLGMMKPKESEKQPFTFHFSKQDTF